MQKIFDHFKTNAGVWTFGLFMAAVAGGIYQFTVFMVSAQVTPVKARLDEQVKRLDAADGNTNRSIARFEKYMIKRFNHLEKGIEQNRERIVLLDRKLEKKIEVLDQKIEKKFDKLDQKISRLDEKMDKKISLLAQKMDKKFDLMDEKFNLILLRLPPLKK
ncbi:MAG: hypothetical protein OXG62_13325 [Nitrospinae bacterium]|nr:hypothetical protein [Nitrospinota bacterium]